MRYRSLLIFGTIFLAACVPSRPAGISMNHGGMMDSTSSPQVQRDGVQSVRSLANIDVEELPEAQPREVMEVEDGQTISLNPMIVRKKIGEKWLPMYGYNGQIPGPLLKVKQGTTITVNVKNGIDLPTTIHWHGVRLENSNDGVPDVTQKAIEPDGTFRYTVTFPDEGVYWYHPHIREDIEQDLGLYGNLLVSPLDEDAYAPVNRTEILALDDILLGDDGLPVPYGDKTANFALMGRFGNTFLVNGESSYNLSLERGSVVRFIFTNTANTRTFRMTIPGARMKLVGADIGRYEREEFVENVTLGPAERAIVDVLFEKTGTFSLRHQSPLRMADMGTITVSGAPASPSYADAFVELRENRVVTEDIETFRPFFAVPVDKTLRLTITMGMMNSGMQQRGMMRGGMMGETSEDGIEWEESNPMNGRMPAEMLEWKIIDEATGKKNMDIDWNVKKGDIVKVRIINDKESTHPMQHPMHFHGQRFLVVTIDGKPNGNLVWKDTVLIPAGSSADLLFDMSNPGEWMFHCHIAEHLTDGMMGLLKVNEG